MTPEQAEEIAQEIVTEHKPIRGSACCKQDIVCSLLEETKKAEREAVQRTVEQCIGIVLGHTYKPSLLSESIKELEEKLLSFLTSEASFQKEKAHE